MSSCRGQILRHRYRRTGGRGSLRRSRDECRGCRNRCCRVQNRRRSRFGSDAGRIGSICRGRHRSRNRGIRSHIPLRNLNPGIASRNNRHRSQNPHQNFRSLVIHHKIALSNHTTPQNPICFPNFHAREGMLKNRKISQGYKNTTFGEGGGCGRYFMIW